MSKKCKKEKMKMDNQSPNKKIYSGGNLKKVVERTALKQVYLHIDALKKDLSKAGYRFKNESVKKYLYLLVKGGKLYSAGRGWLHVIDPYTGEEVYKTHGGEGRDIVRIAVGNDRVFCEGFNSLLCLDIYRPEENQ